MNLPPTTYHLPTNKGFALVEVLLSIAVFALIVTAFAGALVYGQQSTALAGMRARAAYVASEGLEATRNIRDALYTNLVPGTQGLVVSSGHWVFSGSSDATDIFTRQIQIAPVGATRNTITSTVTWQQNAQRSGSTSLVTYFTNWRRSNGSAVPIVPEATLNLPGPGSGTEVALYTAGGVTYAIESRTSSSDKELYVINVTNPSAPTIAGSVEIGSTVNDVAIVGSYAYLATSDNTSELQVVSLATPTAPTVVGSLGLAGNADAQTIIAAGNNLYIGRIGSSEPEIDSISIASPTAPTLLSTLEAGDSVWKLALAQNNTYLYAATGSNAGEFIVINVSNPSSIAQVGSVDLTGTSDATAVESFATYAAVGRDNGDVYIINVATPSSPSLVGGPLAIGKKINDLTIGPGDAYIFAGSSKVGGEVTVIDVGTPSAPSFFFSIDLSGNEATGVIWDPVADKIYGSATSNTAEFFIIRAP